LLGHLLSPWVVIIFSTSKILDAGHFSKKVNLSQAFVTVPGVCYTQAQFLNQIFLEVNLIYE